MTLVSFTMGVVAGLLAGLLAGSVQKRGGYGLSRDMVLGLAGSMAVSGLLDATGVLPEAGLGVGVLAIGALIGGAIPVVTQRRLWPTAA